MSQGTSDSCFICRSRPANSREHLPPKAAGNKGQVEVFYLDSSAAKGGPSAYKTEYFGDGFWIRRFCEKCNNTLGRRSVPEYRLLLNGIQEAAALRSLDGRMLLSLTNLHPLRILKQMLAMFLAALPKQPAIEWKSIQDFVRLRDTQLPPEAPKVYLYHTPGPFGRIVPFCGFIEFTSREKLMVSEIAWPPIGIVFSDQRSERLKRMADISSWGSMEFGHKRDIQLALPTLEVSSPFPLVYGSREESERERDQRGHAYLVQVSDTPGGIINVAAQLRKVE